MEAFFRKIVADAKLASGSELAELKRIQAAWVTARDMLNASTDAAAKVAYSQHLKELSGAIAGGTASPAVFSWQAWQQDFATRQAAARMAMNQTCIAAIPLAAAIAEKFCQIANDLAAEVEHQEAAQHANFAVPYHPSELVVRLKQAAQLARGRIPQGQYANSSPASMLPYLDL